MKTYRCLCCGYRTLDSRGDYDICPVCFWEDDRYIDFDGKNLSTLYHKKNPTVEELMDKPSGANHGLTLRQGKDNYLSFGACEKSILEHVRDPHDDEK